MSVIDNLINKPIDRYFAKRAGKFARERTKLEEARYWAAAARNIAPVSIREHHKGEYILINNRTLARCVIVGVPEDLENGYPEGLRDTLITKLIELSTHGRQLAYSFKLTPISTREAKKEIQTSIYMAQVNADETLQKNIKKYNVSLRDMDHTIAMEHNISNYRAVTENKHKSFHSSFIITMWADNEKELYATEADITAILESEQVKYEYPDFFQKTAFLSAQPYNLPSDFAEVQLLSPYAAVLCSSRSPNSRIDKKGVWFGIDKVTKKNIIIDVDKLIAPHLIGLGATGSGKTASTFALLMRMLDTGTRVIYMTPKADAGTNHRAMVDFYGSETASLVDIGPKGGHNINPLQIVYDRSILVEDPAEYTHAYNSHKELIIQFLNIWWGDTGSVNMDTRLDLALTKLYDRAGIKRDIPGSWHNATWPNMNDLVLLLEEEAKKETDNDDRRTLKAILNKTRSVAAGGLLEYINKPTNIDFSKDLIVIDLSGTPPSIRDAMNVLVSGICGQRFRQDFKKKTVICVDEAGVFLRNQDLTEFLLQSLTMGRSLGVSLWCLSQQPSDLKKANVSEEFFTNMSMKIVLGLNMTADNIGIVAEQFKLGKHEREQLMTSGVGEGLFMLGSQIIPLKIQLTETELDIIKGRHSKQEYQPADGDNQLRIRPILRDLVTEHNFCLDSWADGFNLPGWKRQMCQNAISGAGLTAAWIRETIISPDGLVGNQSLDHYATVCQLAAYIIEQGGNNVQISHFTDVDIAFSINGTKYGIEYEVPGSHNGPELQEKRSRALKKYNQVYFVCAQKYEQKLKKYVGEDSVFTRGAQIKTLIDSLLN